MLTHPIWRALHEWGAHFHTKDKKGLTLLILITFVKVVCQIIFSNELYKFDDSHNQLVWFWLKTQETSAAGLKAKLDKLIERIDDEDGYGDLVNISNDNDDKDKRCFFLSLAL